jgi:tripartite-type tricarboxylate transporter receptor subunit TctC
MKRLSWLSAAAALLMSTGLAHAQPFYQGKTVALISGGSGGYDHYSHLLATHMRRYIPGAPNIVAKSMPGAASMLAANYLYNVAAPDGLTFGSFVRTIPLAPLLGDKAAKYQPEKFTWLGSSSRYLDDAYMLLVKKSLGITSIDQIRTRREPLRLGSTGPSSQSDEGSRVAREVLGLNTQIIRGYQTTPQILLAVERGEVDGVMLGISSLGSFNADWLKPDGPVNFLLQFGYGGDGRHPMFPQVPRVDELAKSADDKAIFELLQLPFKVARPFAGPPNMPRELVAILRDAFMHTHEDAQYLADAKKMGLDVSPLSGEDATRLIERAAAFSPEVMKRYADLIGKGSDTR